MQEFASVHEDLKALCRRVDVIVPFLPFTTAERKVVADIALTDRFSLYREPCRLQGPEEKRRSFGNLSLRSTRSFAAYAASCYDPMQGASGMLSVVQQADGKFQMMNLRDQLGLTESQKLRVKSENASSSANGILADEPSFWVHFDKQAETISISQSRPVDDDDSCCDSNEAGERAAERPDLVVDEGGNASNDFDRSGSSARSAPREAYSTVIGAADDVF